MNMQLKEIIYKFIIIYNWILSYENYQRIKSYKNTVYSAWVKQTFKACNKGFCVRSPANIKGGKYITIGENFRSGDRLRLECWDKFAGHQYSPKLIIGNNVVMNYCVHIACINNITIGNNVLIGSNILITDHQHGYIDQKDIAINPVMRPLSSKGPVIIEDNVWIGENVSIMPNVIIGRNSIIGANTVVSKSFPANSVIAGIPSRLIRTLA